MSGFLWQTFLQIFMPVATKSTRKSRLLAVHMLSFASLRTQPVSGDIFKSRWMAQPGNELRRGIPERELVVRVIF
jgi:hypothetical protein